MYANVICMDAYVCMQMSCVYMHMCMHTYEHVIVHVYAKVHHVSYHAMIFSMQQLQVVHGKIATIVPPL